MKTLGVALAFIAVAVAYSAAEEVPMPPAEADVVRRLVDAVCASDERIVGQAVDALRRHADAAAPLLRKRLEDPSLPNWVIAANELERLAPAELEKLEAMLGKARPELTVRYHLWRIARAERQPYRESYDPFQPADEHLPFNVAAIKDLSDAAVPELQRSLHDRSLGRQAAYVVGKLGLRKLTPGLLEVIPDTVVYGGGGGGWHAPPPPRRYSLAAAALAAMGPDGREALVKHLAGLWAPPDSPRDDLRVETATLILEALRHVRADDQLRSAFGELVRLGGSARLLAVRTMMDWSPPEGGKYALPVPLETAQAVLDGSDGRSGGEEAGNLARHLARSFADPQAAGVCLRQLEKGRFLYPVLSTWANAQLPTTLGPWSDAPDTYELRRRLFAVLFNIYAPQTADRGLTDLETRRAAAKLLAADGYGWTDVEPDSTKLLSAFRSVLLSDARGEDRELAARGVAYACDDATRNIAFDILAEAIDKALAKPELREKGAADSVLTACVRHISRTASKNPCPLLERIVSGPFPEEARNAAWARLAEFADLASADTVVANGLAAGDASVYFGIHLLPAAVEKINGGQAAAVPGALACIERLVVPSAALLRAEDSYRWNGVVPDKTSVAVATLAAQHCRASVVRYLENLRDWNEGRTVPEYAGTLQMHEAIPALVKLFPAGSAAYGLSCFQLDDRYYAPLFEKALQKNPEALVAIAGTPNERAVRLYAESPWLDERTRLRFASALVRAGDKSGVDMCLPLAGRGDWAWQRLVFEVIGDSKTADAAAKIIGYIAAKNDFPPGAAEALRQIGKPAVPVIVRTLSDPLWPEGAEHYGGVRAQLVDVLGAIGDERAVPILKWLAEADDNSSSRSAAIAALTRIGSPETVHAAVRAATGGRRACSWGDELLSAVARMPDAPDLCRQLALHASDNFCRDRTCLVAARLAKNPEETRGWMYPLWQATDPRQRDAITAALVWLGDKRVAAEAVSAFLRGRLNSHPGVAGFKTVVEPEDVARLDGDLLVRGAEELLGSQRTDEKVRAIHVLARLGVRSHEAEFRKLLDSRSFSLRRMAESALIRLQAPGIIKELCSRAPHAIRPVELFRHLAASGTDEAADALAQWEAEPARKALMTRGQHLELLYAMRGNGRPKAVEARRKLLYDDLEGSDVPLARRALDSLAETDREGLERRLVELAASPKGHLRCLVLYGLMKHFDYRGAYDPFESGGRLAEMVKQLRAERTRNP